MTGTGPLVAFEILRLVGIPIDGIRVSPFGFLVPSFSLQLCDGSSLLSLSPFVHDFPCPNGATGTSRLHFLVIRVLSSALLPGFIGPESSVLSVDLPPSGLYPFRVLLIGIGFLTSIATFNVTPGGLPWVRRTTSPYPVQLHFGSVRCSLRTWVLPHASSGRPISGTCPCLVGVALPSGNGGRFTSNLSVRRTASASCQAHAGTISIAEGLRG